MTMLAETAAVDRGLELILDPASVAELGCDLVASDDRRCDTRAGCCWSHFQELDLAEVVRTSRPARALIAVRAVPVRLADRLRGRPAQPPPEHVRMVEARPWVVLGEDEPRELVVGAIGRSLGAGCRVARHRAHRVRRLRARRATARSRGASPFFRTARTARFSSTSVGRVSPTRFHGSGSAGTGS